MLIVPVAGDKLSLMSTQDVYQVSSYTSLKPEPAVYLTSPLESGDSFTFFSDITAINGIAVKEKDNLFEASGLIKRRFNLPQPGDVIITGLIETAFKEEAIELEVTSVTIGGKEPRAIVVKCGTTKLALNDIQDIKRKRGFEVFDRKGFLKYYIDYCPLS